MSEIPSKERPSFRERLFVLGTQIDEAARRDATYGDALKIGALLTFAGAAYLFCDI